MFSRDYTTTLIILEITTSYNSYYVIYCQVCPGSLFEQLQCKNYTDFNFLIELKLGINIFIYMRFNETSHLPRLSCNA